MDQGEPAVEKSKGVPSTEDGPYYCSVCTVFCANNEEYEEHQRDLEHIEKTMAKTHIQETPAEPQQNGEEDETETHEDEEKKEEKAETQEDEKTEEKAETHEDEKAEEKTATKSGEEDGETNEEKKKEQRSPKLKSPSGRIYHCKACASYHTGEASWEKHTESAKHKKNTGPQEKRSAQPKRKGVRLQLSARLKECKEPVIGLSHVTEYQKEGQLEKTGYHCGLCESKCDSNMILNHLVAHRHRSNFVKVHHEDLHLSMRHSKMQKKDQIKLLEDHARIIQKIEGRGRVTIQVEPAEKQDTQRAGKKKSGKGDKQKPGGQLPLAPQPLFDMNAYGPGAGILGRGRGMHVAGLHRPEGPGYVQVQELTTWEMIDRLNRSYVEVSSSEQAASALQLSNTLTQSLLLFNRSNIHRSQEVQMREQMLRGQEVQMREQMLRSAENRMAQGSSYYNGYNWNWSRGGGHMAGGPVGRGGNPRR